MSNNLGKLQGLGLNILTRFASSDIPDQLKLRKLVEKMLYQGSKTGFKIATIASRQFKSTPQKGDTARLGKVKKEGVFDLSLTDEQQMTKDSLSRFARELIRTAAHNADHDHAVTNDLLNQAQELGLLYFAVPESLGGVATEETLVTQMLALEELGHGDFSIGAAIFSPVSVANVLTRYGSDKQQAKYLAEFASETPPMATLACNEPQAMFNPMQPATTARKESDGYVLNGTKSLVIMAADSELFIVSATLDNRPVLFIVESGTKGLTFTPEPAMGLKAAKTATLNLSNVHIPHENAILDINFREFLDLGNLAMCALAVGTCQAVLDYVIPYVNEREAFGEPISHRQAVAFMVADIAIELDAMRIMTWRASALAEAGKPFHREAHLARVICQDKAMKIGTDGVQLLGGHGFTKEHPVERWYRDLRCLAVMHNVISL